MDDLIVTFCEDRRSWLVVIAGTLALALVFVLPGVDEYVAVCAEKNEINEQLAIAIHSAQQVGGYEQRMAEKTKGVERALDKTLHEENLADYRNSIVKLVRDSGCQLRRLQIGNPSAREWNEQDNPLEQAVPKPSMPTGFQLQKRVVALSLAGGSANVRRLLDNLEKLDKRVHVQGMELRPSGGDGQQIELSMELWYFTLEPQAA